MNPPSSQAREEVLGAFVAAVRGFDLEARVASALPPRPPARARVRVFAVGKAAPAMARGALSRWGDRVECTLIVAPDGTPCDLPGLTGLDVELLRSSHPLPDLRSGVAAERALSFMAQEAGDLRVVLVSGGTSALLCAPIEGVSLEDKIGVTRALLASGAPIEEVNVVRRHLSRVKGGALSRAAAPGRVLSLLASDTLSGRAYDIGSGPTAVDPTTSTEARAALQRRAPAFARLCLGETLKPDEPAARRLRSKIVATPNDLASAVARHLSRSGIGVTILSPSDEEVHALAAEYGRLARGLAPRSAVVRAAEPRVAVTAPHPGRGGRSAHLAALVGRRLDAGLVFLAGASDGVDGTTGAAGAIVDAEFRGLGEGPIDLALAGFDSESLHLRAATSFRLDPTGLNLADIHVLYRPGS